MNDTGKQVSINDTAAQSLRSMLAQLTQMEGQVKAYIRGLRDSLGLEGEDWGLDTTTMSFVRGEPVVNTNGAEQLTRH